jgi:predicted O-methyltransferase YrrM
MGGITTPEVEDYLYSILPPRDDVLTEMEAFAAEKNVPIVGPAVARVLAQLAMISGAKTVFEMGSAIGYSTIWWARAVGPGGRVTYTDGDPRNAERAGRYFERAGVADRITVYTGDALELMAEQKGEFDIIFIDLDKDDYPRALRLALPRLRKGGLIVADNVLWSGKVATQHPPDAKTQGILAFNRLLYESAELVSSILPIRDGVAVAIKAK